MDLTTIEATRTVFITGVFTGGVTNWTANINIPFTPDFMITKSIIYNPSVDDSESNTDIFCDILGMPIGQIAVNAINSGADYNNLVFAYTPNLMFKLPQGKTINGTVSFNNVSSVTGQARASLWKGLRVYKVRSAWRCRLQAGIAPSRIQAV